MKRVKNTNWIWLLLPIFVILWTVLSVKYLALSPVTCLLYVLFILFLVFLPGYSILTFLVSDIATVEKTVLSFGLGFVLEFVLYFIFAPFKKNEMIPLVLIGLSAVLIVVLLIRVRKGTVKIENVFFDLPLFLICILSVAITFVILSMANLEPDLVGARNYYHDTLNGVGLTVSASRSFPMTSLQMSGWLFPYHIGYYIFTSVMMDTLGITAFEAVMKLSLCIIAPLCVLAFSAIGERIGLNAPARYIACAIFAFIPSFGFMHYLYMDTIGFPFGLLFCFLALLSFCHAQQFNSRVNRFHLLATVFLSAGMISKGPVAVTYLFGFCFVLLIELIKERNFWIFPKGLLYAVPFFLIYFLIYGQGAGDSMSVSFFYSATRTEFAYSIYEKMPEWLYLTLCVLYYTVTISKITTLSFFVVLLFGSSVYKKEEQSCFITFCLSTVFCGMVLINVMKQMGSSEVYFLSGVYPVCFLLGIKCVGHLLMKDSKLKKGLGVVCLLLALLALPQDVTDSWELFIGDDCTEKPSASALKAAQTYSIRNYKEGNTVDLSLVRGPIITPEEYEGFIWLKNNTPEDAVFSDYRYSMNNKYFCGSVFSERSCFLEGWGYVTMEDSNDNTNEKIRRDTIVRFFNDTKQESFSLLLAQEGVEYLIFEKVVTGDWELTDTYVDEVFRNDAMIIYHIRPVEFR